MSLDPQIKARRLGSTC